MNPPTPPTDGSGGIVERAQGGEVTSYHYLAAGNERLDHAITTVGAQSARTNYSYDKGFGDVTSYRLEGAAEPAAEFDYDAFGRQIHAERGAKVEDFSYDGLDRRDTRHGAQGGRRHWRCPLPRLFAGRERLRRGAPGRPRPALPLRPLRAGVELGR